MNVATDEIKNWLCEAAGHETKAKLYAEGNQHGPAMTYFFLAAQMLTMCAKIIAGNNTSSTTPSELCTSTCGDGKAVVACTGGTIIITLQAKIQYLAQEAEAQSALYCQRTSELFAPSGGPKKTGKGGGKGGGDDDDDAEFMKCPCALRNSLEHRLDAESKECQEAWFDLIIGQTEAKDAIRNGFQNPLIYPNLFPAMSKAVLFYGSPGTGKTMLARALTNELSQTGHVRLLLFKPQHSDIKGKWVGESEKKIHRLFKCASDWATATETALNTGRSPATPFKRVLAIVFFDEVEALAGDRAADKTGLMGSTLNTLLQEMDGIGSQRNVVVVAATNYPWQLDAAFLRRFTSRICVTLPTADDLYTAMGMFVSKSILKFALREDPTPRSEEQLLAETQRAVVAEEQCDAPGLCTLADKKAGMRNNQADAFRSNPYVREMPEATLRQLSRDMAAKQYSLSDLNNVMARVIRDVGSAGIHAGIFLRRPLPWAITVKEGQRPAWDTCDASTSSKTFAPCVYISKLCFDQEVVNDKTEILFRLASTEDLDVVQVETPNSRPLVLVHYNADPLILPGLEDPKVVDHAIFVNTDSATPTVLAHCRLRLQCTRPPTTAGAELPLTPINIATWDSAQQFQPACWATTTHRDAKVQYQKNQFLDQIFRQQKLVENGTVVTWPVLQEMRKKVNDSELRLWIGSTTLNITAREEDAYVQFFLDTTVLQTKAGFIGFRKAVTRKLEDEPGFLLNILAEFSTKACYFTRWGSANTTYIRHTITETSSTGLFANTLAAFQTFMTKYATQLVEPRVLVSPLSCLAATNTTAVANRFVDAMVVSNDEALLHTNNTFGVEFSTTKGCTITVGKPKISGGISGTAPQFDLSAQQKENLKRLRQIPAGHEDRLINWNYTDKGIREAFLATPSSADPQMISLINLYKEDPAKLLTCMTETRITLTPKCSEMVKEEQAKKGGKTTK